ncbi:MAG: hypothetical protein MJE66_00495 [Proteobacteria bacterium]|nr:hypothetical protein [Pseudomonadota bacterium]
MGDGGTRRLGGLRASETARVVAFLVAWKLAFYGFAVWARALFPDLFSLLHFRAAFHRPLGGPPTPTTWLETWDAQHYLYLAEHGYRTGEVSAAFFPAWPLAIRALAPVWGGDTLAASLVLANVLSIAALTVLHQYVFRPRLDRAAADTALLALVAFPGALFLQFPYSEALFLALAVGCVTALARDRWVAAGAFALCLPLVRGIGAFIAVPMAFAVWRAWRTDRSRGLSRAPWLLAPVAGVGLYLAWMAWTTGDPWTGVRAQGVFLSQRSLLDLIDVWGLLQNFLSAGFSHTFETSPLDRAAFALFVATLPALWWRHRDLFWYALPMGLLPAMTSFMSNTRYVLVVFPVFLVLGQWLAGSRRRRLRALVLGAFVAIQALLVLLHINFRWAG